VGLHAIILAGGSGTRFWPLSRELAPKQMLTVFGDDSLVVDALNRAQQVVGDEGHMHLVVGATLIDELRNHLLSHEVWGSADLNYIIEPAARNTAPALALAAAVVMADDPDAVIIMLPSDHLTEGGERWIATMNVAIDAAADGSLVTVGLYPTSPETGFGYIQARGQAEGQPGDQADIAVPTALPVKRFVEKPNYADAKRYVQHGNYYWNSGMLVARADAILQQLLDVHTNNPTSSDAAKNDVIVATARAIAANSDDGAGLQAFTALPKVPFDKAVLELSSKVKVVPTCIDWSDVGSLLSLEALQGANERGTRVIGQGIDLDSHNTLNYSDSRLVATLGLSDTVVVDTADATLIAARDRVQDVREIVRELHRRGVPEIRQSQTSLRPWGSWTMLTRGTGYQVKEIEVIAGASLSMQKHQQRSEHWIVIAGMADVEIDGQQQMVGAGQSVFIPVGVLHRLSNAGTEPLRIVEVAVGDYLGEDDIERFDDQYGRDT